MFIVQFGKAVKMIVIPNYSYIFNASTYMQLSIPSLSKYNVKGDLVLINKDLFSLGLKTETF